MPYCLVYSKLIKISSKLKQESVGLYVITSVVQYLGWINFELVPLYSRDNV